MEGVDLRKNSQGHRVVKLHYSADPDKRPGTPWYESSIRKYVGGVNSLGWRREMEIDFKAGSGELVFPNFPSLEKDILLDPVSVPSSWNLFAGFDWGNRNPISFHVYAETPEKEFISIWEYYELGSETNVYEVSRVLKTECPFYDRLNWIAYDPALNAENQQRKDGNTSIARMFLEEVAEEFKLEKLMTAHGRADMLAVQMTQVLLAEKRLKFFKTCHRQIDEFRNLKFPERLEYKNEPEKLLDKDNHSWDDWKYMILSHPYAKSLYKGPEFNTFAYYNRISDLAANIANESGRDVSEVFNDLYGQPI